MGCCLSSSASSNSSSPPHRSGSRAPPPLEEESVKEVLSETPKPKPTFGDHSCSGNLNGGIPIHPSEEISEVSDICSFSETLSTATEKLDDYEEIRQRICRSPAKLPKNRSVSGDWVPGRDRPAGKSPTRRSNQSPGRINGGTLKMVQSRDMGQGLASRSLKTESRLQSRAENSYRRSRSPATTQSNGGMSRTSAGQSPSGRRYGMLPGREEFAGRDYYYRTEAGEGQGTQKETMDEKWQTTNESLDNPLVSLECFIFL